MDAELVNIFKGNHKYEVSVEELATEIAQCLQIENLNFLIGAGCSSYRDDNGDEKAIPTMAGLAKEFYEKNPTLSVDRKHKAKDMFPNNLEALINYFVSLRNIISSEASKKTISGKINTINRFIFEKICNTPHSQELIRLYKEFYLRIVKKTRQAPVNIFTTNYDLYNENALDELGFMYNNGFLGSAQRIFNPNSYNYVVVENLGLSRDVWKSVSNYINLFKIHGSINWIKDEGTESDTPHIREKDIELIKRRNKHDSLMIYPTPQKDRTTLMVPYSDLFRMMQNSLLKKNSVLISLGYSFGDEHINRIILNALSVYDFRLVVFGDSDMIRKLQAIGDNRIWIINSDSHIQYFKNFVEKVLPAQDDEQREELEIKKSLKKLAVVLGDSASNP